MLVNAPQLPVELAATLVGIAGALRDAADPWWVIGSAAMVLHGANTRAADVDVLLSVRDADALLVDWRIASIDGEERSDRFRSDRYARYGRLPMPVEVMAGFQLRTGRRWRTVVPLGRLQILIGGASVFVPALTDLIAMCASFGRPKDIERAALLSDLPVAAKT